LLAIWVFLLGFMPYRNAKKVMVAQKYLREPITYTFTEEGLSGSSSSTSYTLAWDVFKKVRESKSLFLLYHGTNIAIVLPKHFFQNEAQIEDWRQFAATHLESKRIDKPSVVARFL